jgi:hypothetical protein
MPLRLDRGLAPLAIVTDHYCNHAGDGAEFIETSGTLKLFEFHRLWIVLLFFLRSGKLGIVLQHTSMRNAAMHFAICGLHDRLVNRTTADEINLVWRRVDYLSMLAHQMSQQSGTVRALQRILCVSAYPKAAYGWVLRPNVGFGGKTRLAADGGDGEFSRFSDCGHSPRFRKQLRPSTQTEVLSFRVSRANA